MASETDRSAKGREETPKACRDFFAGLRGSVGLRFRNWLLWKTWIEVPASDAVDTDSFLEFGRAEVVAGGQRAAGVERDSDALFVFDQVDDAPDQEVIF